MENKGQVLHGTLANSKGIFEIYGPFPSSPSDNILEQVQQLTKMLQEAIANDSTVSLFLGPEWKIVPLLFSGDKPHIVGA